MRYAKLSAVATVALAVVAVAAWTNPEPNVTTHMRRGSVGIQSIGAMAFGPGNVLFVGDSKGATVFAIDLEDKATARNSEPLNIDGIDAKIAAALGTTAAEIMINDMAVHHVSQNVYFSVSRGRGADAAPVLLRATRTGTIEEVSLQSIRFSSAAITNAPAVDQVIGRRRTPARTLTVTDIGYADGQVFVAGLSNEEFASNLRRIPFPFDGSLKETSLEIYHVSHGANETQAPVMTFVPYTVGAELNILAAYTCTPLVAFPIGQLKDGDHAFGRTVAELGAGNQPLDIISYTYGGQSRLLLANSRHPLMKIDPSQLGAAKSLTSPTKLTGLGFVPVQEQGIRQLADLNAEFVVVLQQSGEQLNLKSLPKKSL